MFSVDPKTESPDATVNLEQTSDGITASVLRNENVDNFTLIGPNGFSQTISSDLGTTKRFAALESGDYSIIANVPGGDLTSSTDHINNG